MGDLRTKQMSRKDFIKGVGVSLAGVAMAGSLGGLLTACSNIETAGATGAIDVPKWPFKYKKLDPEKVMERAYKTYQEKGG